MKKTLSIILGVVGVGIVLGIVIFIKLYTSKTDSDDATNKAKPFEEVIDVTPNAVNEYSDEDDKVIGDFASATAEAFLKGDENVCYSPISLYMSLSLLAEASNGETQKEVLQVLGSENIEDLKEKFSNYKDVLDKLNNYKTETILSNSIWIQEEYALENDISGIVKKYSKDFSASVFVKDFYGRDINAWVDENTKGNIKELVPNEQRCDWLAVNTLYYKSGWVEKFTLCDKKGKFELSNGKQINVTYMEKTQETGYIRGEEYIAVEVPTAGATMIFVCPDKNKQLKELINEDIINEILASSSKTDGAEVTLKMPMFDYNTKIEEDEIKQALVNVGAKEMFENFEWIEVFEGLNSSPLSIVQSAKISIDEEGIEGAAATGAMVFGGIADEEPEKINVVLDRPFMYMLVEGGIPLFIGTVYNPTEG